MSPRLHRLLEREQFLREDPAARQIYYGADGHAKPIGARVVNRAYGATLRALSTQGADALYRGEIAADIVRAVRAHDRAGDLTEADLANYRAVERDPLCGRYRQWRLCAMAPPSSGGVAVLQILGVLERAGFDRAPPHSESAVHLYTEAARLAYADRARFLGDPDFVKVPVARLLNESYLSNQAGRIGPRTLGIAPPSDLESGTSHLSIADAQGNAVAMTSTIEATFGSRIMVRGFLLNNELTDFDFVPGGANQIEGGKRPRSSMSPTMVFRDEKDLFLVVGSPGGPWIINFVGKTLVARLDWGLELQAAVDAPNFGSRNGPTEIERGSSYEALAAPLRGRGHQVILRDLTSGVHAIERVPGGWRGAADPRREGVAKGD
jgi:gamma-glutamyltranspeptidase/glutathione hydrolase